MRGLSVNSCSEYYYFARESLDSLSANGMNPLQVIEFNSRAQKVLDLFGDAEVKLLEMVSGLYYDWDELCFRLSQGLSDSSILITDRLMFFAHD